MRYYELSDRIEFVARDHLFADQASAPVSLDRLIVRVRRQFAEDPIQLLIEDLTHKLGRMADGVVIAVHNFHRVAMKNSSSDHQSTDAVDRKVFHVAVQ